jgi:hypothetical protein
MSIIHVTANVCRSIRLGLAHGFPNKNEFLFSMLPSLFQLSTNEDVRGVFLVGLIAYFNSEIIINSTSFIIVTSL